MGAEMLHVDRQTDMMKPLVTFTILQMHLHISRIPWDQGWWIYDTRKIFWACNIHCCPNFVFFFCQKECFYIVTYIYIHTHTHTHTHTHISDCIETVYELPLLPNSTASETFLHKLDSAKSWLDIYHWDASLAVNGWILDIGQKVLWSSFHTGISNTPIYFQIFFHITRMDEAFIRNIIIILVLSHNMH
jgi:hypothetical protein